MAEFLLTVPAKLEEVRGGARLGASGLGRRSISTISEAGGMFSMPCACKPRRIISRVNWKGCKGHCLLGIMSFSHMCIMRALRKFFLTSATEAAGEVDGVVGEARDVAGEARDVAGEARDVAGEARDVAVEARDVLREVRDFAVEARDGAGEVGDVAEEVRDVVEASDVVEAATEFASKTDVRIGAAEVNSPSSIIPLVVDFERLIWLASRAVVFPLIVGSVVWPAAYEATSSCF